MSRIYLDTSALIKLIVEEPESPAVSAYLDNAQQEGYELCLSRLTYTEIHCVLKRRLGTSQNWKNLVSKVMAPMQIIELSKEDYLFAAAATNTLRSLDSLHLEVARRIRATTLVTFDQELAAAAQDAGMEVPIFT